MHHCSPLMLLNRGIKTKTVVLIYPVITPSSWLCRCTFRMVSLGLHEALPGHHMQNMYQNAGLLPSFQKHIELFKYFSAPYHFPFYTAYTEV